MVDLDFSFIIGNIHNNLDYTWITPWQLGNAHSRYRSTCEVRGDIALLSSAL